MYLVTQCSISFIWYTPAMNKARLETFSDGVFAIVMTLHVLEIKVPELHGPVTDAQLLTSLFELAPFFLLYAISFIVLAVVWINHHFIFHSFAKEVDRVLNIMNTFYLMFVVFVPFSAHVLASYIHSPLAVVLYGLNLFIIVMIAHAMISYILKHKHLIYESLSRRLIAQSRIRSRTSLVFYALGMICAYVYIPASIFFFAFPIAFNFIPGTIDFLEKWGMVRIDA